MDVFLATAICEELPGCLQSSSKSTFLVLIGTNNLGAGFSVEQTVKGIMAVAEWLLENTQGRGSDGWICSDEFGAGPRTARIGQSC